MTFLSLFVSSCSREGVCNFEISRKTRKKVGILDKPRAFHDGKRPLGGNTPQSQLRETQWTEIRDEKLGGKCAENGIEFCRRIRHFVVAGFGGKEILTGLDGSCPWLRNCTEIVLHHHHRLFTPGWLAEAHARGRLVCCWRWIEKVAHKSSGEEEVKQKVIFFCLKSRC